MLRCTYGVGGGVRSGCQLMADGAMGWSGAAREERKRRKIKIRVTHVKHSLGEFTKRVAARLRRNLGFTQKNFASLFEYSTVVPGCHAFALAALCMDVVLETQDLK